MNKKTIQKTCAIIFLGGLFFFISRVVHAEERTGLQVSPLSVEKEVRRGDKISFAVEFFNPLNVPQNIRPKFKDIVVSGSGAAQKIRFLDYSSPRYTISRWADFPKDVVGLEPHQSKTVPITIKVPQDAAMGSHFGGFFGEIRSDNTEETRGPYYVEQHVAAGALVFLSVVQEGLQGSAWSGEISDFKVQGKKIGGVYLSSAPLALNTNFKNEGIFHQNVWGAIRFTNLLGTKEKSIRLNEKKALPEGSVIFSGRFIPKMPIGKYTAEAELLYGRNGEKEARRKVNFWVFDPRILWVVPIILAVLVVKRLQPQKRERKRKQEIMNNE